MLHEALRHYLNKVEQAVLECGAYVERYTEEILTPERINLRIRLRFSNEHLLEISEAVIVSEEIINHFDYRYHCQDGESRLIFRYDSTPHFPNLASFPHHKHLPTDVINSVRPDIARVVQEATLE